MKDKNNFEYKYVAPTATERREIESIKNSYMPLDENQIKLNLLRKMDRKVKNLPTIISIIIGTIGILMFGLGLTMILEWKIYIWGISLSIIGIIPTILSYPIFIKTQNYLKNKYGNKIIKLSDELLNKNKE